MTLDKQRWSQVETLYHAALEREPGAREGFLAQACAGDEELRREVEELLRYDGAAESFIQGNALAVAAQELGAEDLSTIKAQAGARQQIGAYKILAPLGKGGMGEVHLALDTRLGRKVALKLLPAGFTTDSNRVQRFAKEARAASALNHPNIITIHEVGEASTENVSTHYIVTEYVEGETLRQRMVSAPQHQIEASEAIDIALQIATALAAAHEAGITHRDIKPENVMVRRDGIVKVLDFGLAKLTEPASPVIDSKASTLFRDSTDAGVVMGTPRYMSPEQVRGEKVDVRTDIFSLGVLLYELVAGHPPFVGAATSEVIAAILRDDPPPLARYAPEATRELEQIISQALRKDREERYQSARDMLSDLKDLKEVLMITDRGLRIADSISSDARQKEEEIEALPAEASLEARTPQNWRHQRMVWASLAVVLFTIVALYLLVPLFRPRPAADWRNSLRKTQLASLKSMGGDSLERGRFSPDGRFIVYATFGGGPNLWLAQIGGGPAFQINREQWSGVSPIWSPDGRRIAFISDRGGKPGVWVIPAFGGTPNLIKTLETEGKSDPVLRDWARSDETVFYEWYHNYYALSLTTQEIVRVTNFDAAVRSTREFRLSPDGLTIAYVESLNGQDDIWIVDRRGGAPRRVTNDPASDRLPAWHPDGKRLLYTSERDGVENICVAYLDGGQPEQITFEDGGFYVSDVSVDGSKILYYTSKDEADLWEVDVESGREKQITSDIGSELWPSVSNDGAKLAFQAIKGANITRKINNAQILTKSLETEAGATQLFADGYAPQWSPDGLKVGVLRLVDGHDELWVGSADSGQTQAVTREQVVFGGYIPNPSLLYQNKDFCWSPDSRLLAYSSRKNGIANIWTIAPDGAQATKVSDNANPDLKVNCPIWASDGKRLIYLSELARRKDGPPQSWQIWLTYSGKNETIFQTSSILRLLGWGRGDDQVFIASASNTGYNRIKPTAITVARLSLASRAIQQVAQLPDAYLANTHLAPDGKSLSFVSRRNGLENIWLLSLTGGRLRQLTRNSDPQVYFTTLAWSPDARRLYYGRQSRWNQIVMLDHFQ